MTTLADLAERAEAIHQSGRPPDFEPLAASFKRIKNILEAGQTCDTWPLRPELLTRAGAGSLRGIYSGSAEH